MCNLRLVTIVAIGLLVAAGGPPRSPRGDDAVQLPKPPREGGRTLLECLWSRHSTREFSSTPLPEGALARVLWAADGVNRGDGKKRTAPSAFDRYPISIYVVEKENVSRFAPERGTLQSVKQPRNDEQDSFRQRLTRQAPVVLVLVADLSELPKQATEGGAKRLELWTHAECGAIAQNVYLACADLGLGTVLRADTRRDADRYRELLALDEGHMPVYTMPIGKAEAVR